MSTLTMKNFTRQSVPGLPFADAARAALPGWEISLVFVGERRAKAINIATRNKTYTPNVLSYAVGEKHGEIIICPKVAARQAPKFGLSARHFVFLLFIHGLLHLKGYRHGLTMEQYERKLLALFAGENVFAYDTTHRNGNRYRHRPGQTGRTRRGR